MNFFIPLAAALLPTLTPGVWDGYCGTSKCSPAHETVEDCAEALAGLKGPGNYTCRTITRVVVSEYDDVVVLSWTPPTTNTDGTPVSLAKYQIKYGPSATQLNLMFEIQEPGATAWSLPGLSKGAWYFTVLACNTERCSAPSSIASKVI